MSGFLSEAEPVRGIPQQVAPGIRRIVAPNPSPMTYWGTNTYLIDGTDGPIVLDPGPDDPAHIAAVLAAGPVARILLSHTHHDHLGAVAALRERTGAPVHAWHTPSVPVGPFEPLRDGDAVAGWTAVFTPGHAGDHVCFARDGVVFSADHVMGWSSSVVSPPDGDMAAYVQSLRRMLARPDHLYLPGHGPPVPQPAGLVRALLTHRMMREAAILAALGPAPVGSRALTKQLYSQVEPMLLRAAERNVLAHLQKLVAEGRAVQHPDGWSAAPPREG